MSTILKALRRLEEDSPTAAASSDSLPATDPLAADELRDRILAEEFAAQAAAVAQHESGRTRRFALIGAAALLTLAVGVGAYMMSTRTSSDQSADLVAATPPPSSPPVPVAASEVEDPRAGDALMGVVAIQPTEDREVVSPVSVPPPLPDPVPASTETPPKQEDEMALAAVTPTPSVRAANLDRPRPATETVLAEAAPQPQPQPQPQSQPRPQAQRSRPKPTVASANPPSVSAPKPASPTPQSPPRDAPKPSPSVQKSKPAKSRPTSDTRQVDHHDSPVPTPDLTIIRTSWHPRSDRRSAKIRLEESEEILTLREGDAVGGLVIQEISPSAVVFKSGDVEIHRRVGQPGSGG